MTNKASEDEAKGETELPFTTDSLTITVNSYVELAAGPCASTVDLNYLAHLNAPNIARDLDLIRNLTGFETMDYYGWHYGTVIGVTYAGLFPQRVRHMVLDCT
jgi:pimeloyl-ACP methyl ester carboxylesterase